MSSTYSTSLRIELQATGENSGTWGTITNNNFSQSLEFSIAGVVSVAMGNSDTTLTNADGPQSQANNQARNAMIIATGAHSQARVLQFPATQKIYLIRNATTDAGSSGPYAITARLGASGNTLSIANGTTRLVATDGTNWFDVFSLAGSIDLQGQELILDADNDTSITADTDDRIDIKIANTDHISIGTSSGDTVIKPMTDAKDIIIQQFDGTSLVEFNDGAYSKFTAMAYFPEATLTDASTISWNVLTSPVAKVTLGANRTLGAATGAQAGQFVSLLVIQDGTGSRGLTFNAAYEFKDDTAPTLTTTAAKGDLFVFRYNGSKFLEVGRNLNLTLS